MPQHATINDHVTYRPGDGPLVVIPMGPVEVDLTADSATLSWIEENGAAGLTAIPLTQFNEYVQQKRITLTNWPSLAPGASPRLAPHIQMHLAGAVTQRHFFHFQITLLAHEFTEFRDAVVARVKRGVVARELAAQCRQ